MQRKFPTLCMGNLGVGAEMSGIWSLLRSKEQSGRWNYQFKGALKSALAGRQYTQSRCYAAGFATHKACLVCLHHLMPRRTVAARDETGICDSDVSGSATLPTSESGRKTATNIAECASTLLSGDTAGITGTTGKKRKPKFDDTHLTTTPPTTSYDDAPLATCTTEHGHANTPMLNEAERLATTSWQLH